MILDSELIFSGTVSAGTWTGQAITASGATASTGYVDTKAAGDALKPGARIKVIATEAFTGSLTTLTVSLVTGATSSLGKTLISTAAIAKASTTAGTVLLDTTIPVDCLRYLGVSYTTDNTASTGAVFAAIVLDTDRTIDKSL